MLSKKLLPLVSVAVLLTGCGKDSNIFGFGASSDKSREVSATKDSKESESQSIETGRTSSVTKSGFSQRIIADAMIGYAAETGGSVWTARGALAKTSDLRTIAKLDDEAFRKQIGSFILAANAPVKSWPKETVSGSGLNYKAAKQYATGVTATLYMANDDFQLLDKGIQKVSIANPVEAEKAVRKLYKEAPIADQKAAWIAAVDKASMLCKDIVFNTTSAEGTAWQCPNASIDVTGDQKGYVLVVGGKEVFGNGYIGGMEAKIAFDDSNSTKQAIASETSTGKGVAVKETNTTSAGAKVQ